MGGKEKRKEGGGPALWKAEETRGPALYLVFGIAAGAGLGGCLYDPHRPHLRPSSESYFLVLSCPPQTSIDLSPWLNPWPDLQVWSWVSSL